MKTILKIAVLVAIFAVSSCRDNKKETLINQETEQIETIEIQTDSIINDLEVDAEDLEKEIEQLENYN